uniref:Putative secreted protein n=1 Tax=Anopheles darlingi TaxID=43151 RepID=A0A2M4D7P8_ANODA
MRNKPLELCRGFTFISLLFLLSSSPCAITERTVDFVLVSLSLKKYLLVLLTVCGSNHPLSIFVNLGAGLWDIIISLCS